MLMLNDVRRRLTDVIVGRLDVRDFDLWISNANWDAHRFAEPNAREMLDSVQMRLVEYFNSDAHRNPDDLRRDLASILNNVVVSEPVDITPNFDSKSPRAM